MKLTKEQQDMILIILDEHIENLDMGLRFDYGEDLEKLRTALKELEVEQNETTDKNN